MTDQSQTSIVFPQESTDGSAQQEDTSSQASTNPAVSVLGTISKTIGTGENAKNSIIWMTITWSFVIASGITLALLIFLFVAYIQNKEYWISELTKHMFSVWTIFTPIITLALGYAFGKNETK